MSLYDDILRNGQTPLHDDSNSAMDIELEHDMGLPKIDGFGAFNNEGSWNTPMKTNEELLQMWFYHYYTKLIEYGISRFSYSRFSSNIRKGQIETIMMTYGGGVFVELEEVPGILNFIPAKPIHIKTIWQPLTEFRVVYENRIYKAKDVVFMQDNVYMRPLLQTVYIFAMKLAKYEIYSQTNANQSVAPKFIKGSSETVLTMNTITNGLLENVPVMTIDDDEIFDDLKETFDLSVDLRAEAFDKAKLTVVNEFLQAIGIPATEKEKSQYISKGENYMPVIKATGLLYEYLDYRKEAMEKLNEHPRLSRLLREEAVVELNKSIAYPDTTNTAEDNEENVDVETDEIGEDNET